MGFNNLEELERILQRLGLGREGFWGVWGGGGVRGLGRSGFRV